jgi:hypothetical protein
MTPVAYSPGFLGNFRTGSLAVLGSLTDNHPTSLLTPGVTDSLTKGAETLGISERLSSACDQLPTKKFTTRQRQYKTVIAIGLYIITVSLEYL